MDHFNLHDEGTKKVTEKDTRKKKKKKNDSTAASQLFQEASGLSNW